MASKKSLLGKVFAFSLVLHSVCLQTLRLNTTRLED